MTKSSDRAIAQAFYEIGAGNSEQAINWQRIERRAREIDAAAPEVLKDLETAAIARGNYGLLDGTRVIGWKLSAETADAMGASGMCLPSEIGDELRRLVKLATWWSTGATGRMESLKANLERLFGDDRPMLRQVWDAVLPLIAPITPPEADAAAPEGAQAVAEVTHVAADNYGHRRRIRWLTDAAIPAGSKLYTTPPQPQGAMPRGVQEALQRMIEDGLLRGPASAEDARLVQRWAEHATTPPHPQEAEDAAAVVTAQFAALLPGPYYMDPPDGGDVTVLEQIRRMAEDAARYRWLRDPKNIVEGVTPQKGGDVLDRAIDAARGAGGGGE